MTTATATATDAQRMLDAAICAYSVDRDRPFQPKAQFWTPIGVDASLPFHHFTAGYNGVDAGFVGVTNDNWALVSLRGTLSSFYSWRSFLAFLDDWWQDDETKPVAWSPDGTCAVHVEKGFLTAALTLRRNIAAALAAIDAATPLSGLNGVRITGHSKGAAMTFLVSAMIKQAFPQLAVHQVYGFATPNVGLPDFADWYTRQMGAHDRAMIFQRQDDIVPFAPPTAGWDLFDHIRGSALADALWLAALSLHRGYATIGEVTYLPNPATTAPHETGRTAVEHARAAMVAAIHADRGETIAEAHSAVHSYWPAMFRQAPQVDDTEVVRPLRV